MTKKVFGVDEKVDFEKIGGFNQVYTQRKAKREKFVIHNMDGTKEVYNTGILFTLEEAEDDKGEPCARLVAKHCNTKNNVEAYVYGLAHVVMAMVEDEEIKAEMFHE